MDEFMLIFRHEDGGKVASPEQMQIWMKQTMDWIGGIAAQNKYVGGNGLIFDDSRVVRHNNFVTNGPFGEIKETIGGYMIVRAESVEEAVEFAKGSPILQGEGNSMEVEKLPGEMGSTNTLIPHLFRTEYRKIVSVLVKTFGFDQIEIAEDIASETFLAAAQTWGLEGPPDNPVAWLYHVAKNKSKTLLQRDKLFRSKISPAIRSGAGAAFEAADPDIAIDLSPESIADSQLQMMFAICHPSIPRESQIGLSLRILCGFGIEEIADAFLSNKETINKRLFRAREKLREEKIDISMPPVAEIDDRLETVLTTIYLLFNEGYYSESQNNILRKDLCLEAVRLCHMLVNHPPTDKPPVNALLALMCFHASRFEARTNGHGEIILYGDQDETLWNSELIAQGVHFLNRSAHGDHLSKYHLEASIAFWGTQKTDSFEKWENILHLYNCLLQIEYSPIAALNRTFALARVRGKQAAIAEAEKLKLTKSPYYFALLGELYVGIDREKALENFRRALELAKTPAEQQTLRRKMEGA